MAELLFINKVPGDRKAYASKVEAISDKLGINPDWLQFLIQFESAGTFRSSIENSYGCVGLIQFCGNDSGVDYKTIDGEDVKLSTLKNMDNVDQLDWVYRYLKPYKGDMQSFYDLYFAILWPNALGKEDSYVIRTGTNPIFDLNKNGTITVGEVKQFLDNRVKELIPVSQQNSFKKKEISCRYINKRLSLAA